jgi:hypothetical protein
MSLRESMQRNASCDSVPRRRRMSSARKLRAQWFSIEVQQPLLCLKILLLLRAGRELWRLPTFNEIRLAWTCCFGRWRVEGWRKVLLSSASHSFAMREVGYDTSRYTIPGKHEGGYKRPSAVMSSLDSFIWVVSPNSSFDPSVLRAWQ